jgi:hypothetical protein
MLARRRQLMESWTEYCSRPDDANGVVVPLPSAKVVKLKGRRR